MKTHFFILLFLMNCVTMFAQQFTITGKVYDKANNNPLEAATVFVKSVKDSSLVNYTISDNKGVFNLKGRTQDKQLDLFITHVGHSPYKKRINTPEKTLDLGTIMMEMQTQELEGVTVTSDAIPVSIKKDTLEFNADAFKLRPDATVEELLKNLPGVEVDSQGNITVNGVPVNEILVNGKPFFSDPKIATKNLTKDIVKKVQVSDTKTKEQKFTKEEGDSNNKSINIVLKEDKNKGYFGRITAGYGTKDRYELNGIANYFKNKTRVSLLGSSNNINSSGFEIDEVYGMMGRSGGGSVTVSGSSFSIGNLNFGSSGDGLNRSDVAGISYVDEYGKEMEMDGNYFYTHSENESYTRSERETTLPDRHYFSNSERWGNSWGDAHSVNTELEYKIDTLTRITIRPQFSSSRSNSGSSSLEESLDSDHNLVNRSKSNNESHSLQNNFSNRVSLNRRFKERGFWGIQFSNNNSRSERDQQINNIREIFGTTPSTEIRDQQQRAKNRSDNYAFGGNIRYPLSKTFSLEARYNFSKTDIRNDVRTYDADANGNYVNFNTPLSSDFLTENSQQRASAGFALNTSKIRWSASGGVILNRLQNDDFLRNMSLDRRFSNPSLQSNFRYEIKKGMSVQLNYNTNTNIPSVSQLQPIDNVNNPLHTYTGNPDLKPAFSNSFYLNFNNFNWETRSGYFVWAHTEFQSDKITSITLTNSDLTRRTTYTNIDGDFSARGGVNFNKSHKIEKNTIRYGLYVGGGISKNNAFSNGVRYALTNYSASITPNFGYNYDEKIDLELRYSPSYNRAKYNLETFQNQEYTSQMFSFKITTFVPKNVIFGSDFSYSYLPYMGEDFRKGYMYWNMSLGYKFLEDRATLQLKAFDLLNQTVDAWRTITEDYVQDSQKLMLKQYFMLSFSYKLNKVGGSTPPQTRGGRARIMRM